METTGGVQILPAGLRDFDCWGIVNCPAIDRPAVLASIRWTVPSLSLKAYSRPSAQVAEVSAGTVEVFVDRYCGEHAGATVAEAAMRMSDRYSGRNAPPK